MTGMKSLAELAGSPKDQQELQRFLRQMHRVWVLSATPPIPHLEIGLQEALEPLRRALDQEPLAAAHLRKLPLGEAFIAVMCSFGQALRIPVRVRASQEDWAQLAAVLRPERGSYTPRHAQRVWAQLQTQGRGVRAQRFSSSRRGAKGKRYQWAWRKRKDGKPYPSSLKCYPRAFIRSVAYASREALADHIEAPEIGLLARALAIPRAWRTGRWARFRSMPILRRTNFKLQLKIQSKDDLKDIFSSLLRRSIYGGARNVISKTDRYAVKNKKGLFPRKRSSSGRPLARSPAPADAVARSDARSSTVEHPSPPRKVPDSPLPRGESASTTPTLKLPSLKEVLPNWIPPWIRKES